MVLAVITARRRRLSALNRQVRRGGATFTHDRPGGVARCRGVRRPGGVATDGSSRLADTHSAPGPDSPSGDRSGEDWYSGRPARTVYQPTADDTSRSSDGLSGQTGARGVAPCSAACQPGTAGGSSPAPRPPAVAGPARSDSAVGFLPSLPYNSILPNNRASQRQTAPLPAAEAGSLAGVSPLAETTKTRHNLPASDATAGRRVATRAPSGSALPAAPVPVTWWRRRGASGRRRGTAYTPPCPILPTDTDGID